MTGGAVTRGLSTGALVSKHLRTAPGASLAVGLLVLVLSGLAVFGPLALTAVSDAALRYRLDAVSPAVRDVQASIVMPPSAGPGGAGARVPEEYTEVWGGFDAGLERVRSATEEPLTATLESAEYFVRMGEPGEYVGGSYLGLDPFYESHISIVDGRLPQPTASQEEWDAALAAMFEGLNGDPLRAEYELSQREGLPPVEIVLSTASAEKVEWAIGETRVVGSELGWGLPLRLTLVGTFEAVDANEPYWIHVGEVLKPAIGWNPDGVEYVRPTGFVSPNVLEQLAHGNTRPFTSVWYPMDVEAITASNAAAVTAQLRGFTSVAQQVGSGDVFGLQSLDFQADAIPTLDRAIAEGRSLVALVAMLAAGPLGVAAAVLVLGARMMLERRRGALALLSARGATPAQLRRLLGIEGLVVAVVPTALGATLGFVTASLALSRIGAMPGPLEQPALLIVPALLAFAPAVVLAASAGVSRARGRADAPTRRSAWSPILEWAVTGLAVVATALLVVRGLGDPMAPIDPLVSVAPLLLAFVVCIATLHVYPLFLRGLQARLRRGSGFAGFLGAARALRDPATGLAPVLALIVGVSIAVSSGILLSTLETGADRASRANAGGDLQLQSKRFDEGAAEVVADLPGVEAVAPVGEARTIEVLVDSRRKLATVYLVDQDALADVQGADGLVPDGVSLGDGTTPMPVLFSQRAMAVLEPEGELLIGGEPAEVADVVTDPAPSTSATSWLLTDAAYGEAIYGREVPVVSILVRLDDGTDAAAVAAAARDALGDENIRWLTPESVRAAVDAGPAASGLRVTLIACIALAALLCAIAVVMTLVLGTRARSRILALLQTLGAPPRSGSAIVAWELWPACAAAVVAGALYGAALPVLLLRVVDLTPFTGGAGQPAYAADPLILIAAIGGFLVVALLFTLAALAISRRVRAAAILRTVEDS